MSILAAAGRAVRWVATEAWEKINVVESWRSLKALGRKHGKRFFVAAVIWELIEDGLFPLLSWLAGVPALIPFFLIFHFEPVAYPVIFWLFRVWDRHKGRIPEGPDRPAMSSNLRSVSKVVLYQMVSWGWLWAFLAPLDGARIFGIMAFFVGLMTPFGFVHERVWHESNFGVRPDDSVDTRRPIAKTFTYRLVSITVMVSALHAALPDEAWGAAVAGYQAVTCVLYLALECVWAKTAWGIRPVSALLVESPSGDARCPTR